MVNELLFIQHFSTPLLKSEKTFTYHHAEINKTYLTGKKKKTKKKNKKHNLAGDVKMTAWYLSQNQKRKNF